MEATISQTRHTPEYSETTVRFPAEMGFVFDADDDLGNTIERDAMLLYPYIMQGRISNGCAAEILGIPKWDLIEWYESRGIICLATTSDDLERDLATLRELHGRL